MPTPCPTDAELAAFLAETLQPLERDRCEQHFMECEACRRRLDTLTGGTLPSGPAPFGPNKSFIPLQAAMEELRRLAVNEDEPPQERSGASGVRLRQLGDYEILEELGRGGMGVVYRARQARLQREVAVKVILGGQLASAGDVRRFHVEAEAAARLDHPNIVPIFEIAEDGGHHFFSMKLVEGASLAERPDEFQFPAAGRGSSSAEYRGAAAKVANLVAAIARAVHYAHERGVLHRDLKPGNILIDRAGAPHVTDFGLAKLLEHDSSLTHSAAVLGTPNYIAPEQAAGHARDATTAVDIYSLGAILYELLAGQPPFQAESPAQTLRLVIEAEPVSPKARHPAVPADLATICLKCLEKDPRRRYLSANQVAEELDRFGRGEPLLARPVTWPERARRWCRRQPVLAGLSVALILAIGLGFAGIVWKWRGEVDQRRRAEGATERAGRAITRLEIERAESLFQAGDSSRGLAALARLLRQQPTNSVVAERLISALSDRSFCLPVARLQHGRPLQSLTGALKAKLANRFAFAHPGSLVVATFSPEGSRVLTASTDGTARLWNAVDGQSLGEPLRHEAELMWAQFSDDGRRIVTASVDGSAKIWTADTLELAAPPLRHEAVVHFAAFSPDRRTVVTASRDKTVRIWDARTGAAAGGPLVHPAPCVFACYSPDGGRILTADEATTARLWDARSGAELAKADHFHFAGNPAPYPRFHPSFEQLVTLRWHAAVLRWGRTNFARSTVLLSDHYCTGAAYSPDGQRIATVSMDATARLWSPLTGEAVLTPLHHEAEVLSALFSWDGQRLVTSSRDKSARLWDVRTGQPLSEPIRHEDEVFAASLDAGGQRVVTMGPTQAAWLWDVRLLQPWVILRRLKVAPESAGFSPDGRKLVVSDESTVVRVWDAQSGEFLTPELRHSGEGEILDARFSPDGRRVLTTAEDRTVRVWDPSTGQPIGEPWSLPHSPNRLRFSPDGTRVATAANEPVARILDGETGRPIFELPHAARVNAVEFSRDGSRIVTASADGTAQVWEASTGRAAGPPLRHDAEVFWAGFDRQTQRVATASKDKTVRIWSVLTGQLLVSPLGHADALHRRYSVLFSPDGSRLATVAGSVVQVWNPTNGSAVTSPLRHGRLVQRIQFSPDGRKLLTASDDGVVRLWDPETGHAVSEPMVHRGPVASAEFSPDGSRIVTCSADLAVRIWEVTSAPLPVPEWLPDLAEAVAGQQIDAQDVSTVVPVEALYRMRLKLQANSEPTHYGRWARWFAADSASRSISLSSETTAAEYVQHRIDDGTRDSLQEAVRFSATNATAFARLARNLASTYRTPIRTAPAVPQDADWFSSCATNLIPDDPEVRQIRREVLDKLSAPAATGKP